MTLEWAKQTLTGVEEPSPDPNFIAGSLLKCPYKGTTYNATLEEYWQARKLDLPAIKIATLQAVILYNTCSKRYVFLVQLQHRLQCTYYDTLEELWQQCGLEQL